LTEEFNHGTSKVEEPMLQILFKFLNQLWCLTLRMCHNLFALIFKQVVSTDNKMFYS